MKQVNIWIFIITLTALNVTMGLGASRVDDPTYLKGYWKLNGTTKDYSGNGNDGVWVIASTSVTIAGTPNYTEQVYGNLAYQSPQTSYGSTIRIPWSASIKDVFYKSQKSFSVSYWADTTKSQSGAYSGLMSWEASKKIAPYSLLYTNGVNMYDVNSATIFGGTVSYPNGSKSLVHVTYVYDKGISTNYVYYDGVLASTNIKALVTIGNEPTELYINYKQDDQSVSKLQQWNLRVYNCALTQAEVTEIYNKEQVSRTIPNQSTNEPGLVFHTVDGVTDLSPSLNTILTSTTPAFNPIRGNGIEFTGTTANRQSLSITSSVSGVPILTSLNAYTIVQDFYIAPGYFAQFDGVGSLNRLFRARFGCQYTLNAYGALLVTGNVNSTSAMLASAGIFKDNNRYRLVFIKKLNNTFATYVNGVVLLSGNLNPVDATSTFVSEEISMYNYDFDSTTSRGFVGKSFENKIYNIAQDANWVLNDYNEASRYW